MDHRPGSEADEVGVPLLDLRAQHDEIRDEIEAAIAEVVESQCFVLGPQVAALEAEIADRVGVGHAVGCASGTDALLLPLRALEPEEGDEVVVPAFTFFASAGAAWNAGFRPVFCDVDPDTFTVTGETVEAAWTPRTRAVVPVHLYGQMAPVEELVEPARERGAFVLEDCAQAIGAGRALDGEEWAAGAGGDAGALSFYPTKNLGGFGEGGMVATDDRALADRLRALRTHGARDTYRHETVGTNSRLDALQAAVLRVKVRHLDRWTRARGEHACRYHGMLADVEGVRAPAVAPGNRHVYHQYTILAEERDELRRFLSARQIATGVYYPTPLHLQPCFAELGYREGDLPVSEALCRKVLSLPLYPELGRERQEAVASAIRAFYEG